MDPLIVATMLLLIARETLAFAPLSVSVKPVPATSARSLERFESFPMVTNAEVDDARFGAPIVIAPEEPVASVILGPDSR